MHALFYSSVRADTCLHARIPYACMHCVHARVFLQAAMLFLSCIRARTRPAQCAPWLSCLARSDSTPVVSMRAQTEEATADEPPECIMNAWTEWLREEYMSTQ